MADIHTILDDRGAKYGPFESHAEITQKLKATVQSGLGKKVLPADMQEALDMIAHKIGRIVNGDPYHVDSWDDIAGYATLVADRLRGIAR